LQQDVGRMAKVWFLAGARDFSILNNVQTIGSEADHSPLTSIKVKSGGANYNCFIIPIILLYLHYPVSLLKAQGPTL
jgi:hypothetical protein